MDSPLHLYCKNHHRQFENILKVKLPDFYKLFSNVEEKEKWDIEILLEMGCDVNEKDIDGNTPLHLLVLYREKYNYIDYERIINISKDKINLNIENKYGARVIDYILRSNLEIRFLSKERYVSIIDRNYDDTISLLEFIKYGPLNKNILEYLPKRKSRISYDEFNEEINSSLKEILSQRDHLYYMNLYISLFETDISYSFVKEDNDKIIDLYTDILRQIINFCLKKRLTNLYIKLLEYAYCAGYYSAVEIIESYGYLLNDTNLAYKNVTMYNYTDCIEKLLKMYPINNSYYKIPVNCS